MSFGILRRSTRALIRPALALFLAIGFFVAPLHAQTAQDFPAKPIRVVVPYGTGGGPDTVVRLVANQMSALLGQSVYVDNRGGGAGIPAVQELLNSPADGYTLLAMDSSIWGVLPALQPVPFDIQKDFAPAGIFFTGAQFYAVPESLPARNLREFAVLAKSRPGQLNYGTPGIGTLNHLHGEVLKSALGINLAHIPYKGGNDLIAALVRGDVQIAFLSLAAVDGQVKAGKLKILGVGTAKRSPLKPEVPTVAEIFGIADFDFAAKLGLVARAGTPKPIIDKIAAAMVKAASNPDVMAKALVAGIDTTPSNPQEMASLMRSDAIKFTNIVKASGIKIQ